MNFSIQYHDNQCIVIINILHALRVRLNDVIISLDYGTPTTCQFAFKNGVITTREIITLRNCRHGIHIEIIAE